MKASKLLRFSFYYIISTGLYCNYNFHENISILRQKPFTSKSQTNILMLEFILGWKANVALIKFEGKNHGIRNLQ